MARKIKTPKESVAELNRQKKLPQQPGFSHKLHEKLDKISAYISPYILFCEIFAVIVLIAAGIFFRMEDLSDWRKAESRAFFESQPLHTTFDAYFYLSLAKDIIDGTYYPTDEKRGVPDCPARPSPPPLLSVLAAQITKLSSWSLSWIGAVLPAILGGFLALPLYLLGRYYSGGIAGFTAAILALLYPFYVFRSGFGRFDTDCLNVTFILISAYLFLRFAITTTWKRYIYVGIALINFGFFIWWWDQTPAVVTAITFLPFVVALIFYYRPQKKEACIFGGIIALGVSVIIAFKGPYFFIDMIKAIFHQFMYISKDASGDFPNIGVTISEQSRPDVATIIEYTTGSILGFIFAFTGIAFLLFLPLSREIVSLPPTFKFNGKWQKIFSCGNLIAICCIIKIFQSATDHYFIYTLIFCCLFLSYFIFLYRKELSQITSSHRIPYQQLFVLYLSYIYNVFNKSKKGFFLLSIIILSVLAFTEANRFIIFLIPLLGLGAGYLLGELWKFRRKFLPIIIICPVLFLYFAWPLYYENATNSQLPKLSAATVAGMDAAMHKTPQNAVIWAWWDNGYALTYFARRATINDGSIHSGERTYYTALPLALTDYRLSA
ncbi:MAG: hypothetical protein NTX06_07245, partial [Proteobacteria bacterium]|nr:hypothetical protein [Pseudomonadota bacterium]